MELKAKLEKILKTRYGIDNDLDFLKKMEDFQNVDFGIFVGPLGGGEKGA